MGRSGTGTQNHSRGRRAKGQTSFLHGRRTLNGRLQASLALLQLGVWMHSMLRNTTRFCARPVVETEAGVEQAGLRCALRCCTVVTRGGSETRQGNARRGAARRGEARRVGVM
jgi:hypothetical protein